jgi:hypothetical protein
MGRHLVVLLLWALGSTNHAAAQTLPEPDGVDLLLARLERFLEGGNRDGFALLADGAQPSKEINQFATDLFQPETRRAVVRERERVPLQSALPGHGYRVVAEVFLESAARARILTAVLDVRRPADGDVDSWRLTAAHEFTGLEGLFRLQLNSNTPFAARNLTVAAEDLLVTLPQGSVFLIESEAGVTGLVLLGRGTMEFTPALPTEQGQLRIFAGDDALTAAFDSMFVRFNPAEYEQKVTVANLVPAPLNARDLRRAQELLTREGAKSFNLDLEEFSGERWSLLPQPGDFVAEIRTRRHGTLTYMRALAQSEDITLFDRETGRTISLYPSAERRESRGAAFTEDDVRDYDVLDYRLEVAVSPDREFVDGRARMRLRVGTAGLSTLTLRLADTLAISSVISPEYGRLLHLRIHEQHSVIVNLPAAVARDTEMTLVLTYAGQVASQEIEDEIVQPRIQNGEEPPIPPERNFLLSTRSFWYPQNTIPDYATATVRVTVPEGFGCVASGQLRGSNDVTLRDLMTLPDGKSFLFAATEPLRYLAVVVSRFVPVARTTLDIPTDKASSTTIQVAIEANPRQVALGRSLVPDVEAILRFYTGLLGDAPYSAATVALVEHELPGGHSPAYFAALNSPVPGTRYSWRNDPVAFLGFPEFFIAHELAHQWWGQAVGWRNYHEQWLSEGFAQYFAALYARHTRGERTFADMLRQFRKWSIAESEEGPISLGYRLGHIRSEPRVFRALVYNKGAAVLHMLRQLIGDDSFFRGVRSFYNEQKFRKAGTEDLRRAMEAESGRSLDRFFARWIHGAELPTVHYSTTIDSGTITVRFEQVGDLLFDIPVTVRVIYADGRAQDVVVPVADQKVEWSVRADGAVRQIQINRDSAALAHFKQ